MRIIGGRFRSRALTAPRGVHTRPTSDRVKEALFSALSSHLDFDGLTVLDLYAGTGALGLEALSRGARRVVFVEHDRAALRALEQNVSTLGVASETQIVATLVERARLPGPFHLVFADPPYELVKNGTFARIWAGFHDATAGATLVLEHGSRDPAPELPRRSVLSHRVYGDSALTLYEPA